MVFAVAQKERDQMPFRLAPDQMRRLDRAARERGQSRQAFVEGCVLAELSEHEERRHTKRNAHSLRGETKKEERDASNERVGLGIGETLRKRREVVEEEEQPTTTQAPVIVNVGSNATGGAQNSDIDRLANYVTILRKEMLQLSHACGHPHPSLVALEHFDILNSGFLSRPARLVFGYDTIDQPWSAADYAGIAALMTHPA